MKTKTLSAMTASGLDKQINSFINTESIEPIEVIDIKFTASSGMFAVLIIYK